MEPKIAANFMFACTAKERWDREVEMHYGANNATRIYQISQDRSSLQQDDKSIEEVYSMMIRKCEELNQYQPITDNLNQMAEQRENMYIIRFVCPSFGI